MISTNALPAGLPSNVKTVLVPAAGFTRDGHWGNLVPVATRPLDAVSPSVAPAVNTPRFARLTADEQLYGKVSLTDVRARTDADWARLALVHDGS